MVPWRSGTDDRARPVDPAGLPPLRGGRALKRWRYVGLFGPEAMLCAGLAHVGGVPQGWWAVWDRRAGVLHQRTVMLRARAVVRMARGRVTVRDRCAEIDVELREQAGVETVCPHGADGWIWTRKQAGIAARAAIRLDGVALELDARAVVDDTAGYHARHTAWRWSAGVGHAEDGRAVAWNLVAGVNDPPVDSERSVWIDGAAREVAPCRFAADLSWVRSADGLALDFASEAVRERHEELLLARSDYVQPFGAFSGLLGGGVRLAEGHGVMEDHRARW